MGKVLRSTNLDCRWRGKKKGRRIYKGKESNEEGIRKKKKKNTIEM